MVKCSYTHIGKNTQYGYMLIYSFHQSFRNIVSLKAKLKPNIFFYPLLKHFWLFSHQAFNLFQLLFSHRASQVALPSKQGHVSPKACHTGFRYTSPSMDGDSSNPGYQQGSLSTSVPVSVNDPAT